MVAYAAAGTLCAVGSGGGGALYGKPKYAWTIAMFSGNNAAGGGALIGNASAMDPWSLGMLTGPLLAAAVGTPD